MVLALPELTFNLLVSLACWDSTGCWCNKNAGFARHLHPVLCCLLPGNYTPLSHIVAQQRCGDMYQHQGCCLEYFKQNTHSRSRTSAPHALMPPPVEDGMKVSLWATASHEYDRLLSWFLDSVSLYWPTQRWRSEIIVVMDDTVDDEAWCNKHGNDIRCLLAPPHPVWEPDVLGNSFFFSRGLTRAIWNIFHADLYAGDSDWIAIVQPDVVFFHDFIPDTLFDWSRPVPRPVMFGAVVPHFVPCVIGLGLPWVAEFMEAFPMMVKPSHLRGLRQFVMRQFETDSFAEAFHSFIVLLNDLSRYQGWSQTANSGIYIETIIGNYLYFFHRKEYVWSIKDGVHTGVPIQHTCPALHAGHHLSYSLCKLTGTRRLAERSRYLERTSLIFRMMVAGDRGLNYPQQNEDDDLLATKLVRGDFGSWSTSDGRHCRHRSVDRLLRQFAQLTKKNHTDNDR